MDSRVIVFFLLFCFQQVLTGQEITESLVWDASKKLTWTNFKGTIPPDAIAAATTASGIRYQYSANLIHHEVKLDIKITAFFYPNESWYRPDVCDENVLQHEQLHFDISELFARKMRFKVNNTSFTQNVKAEIQVIYQEILSELQVLQEKYDWETNFSQNREAQAKWNTKIAKALAQFKED